MWTSWHVITSYSIHYTKLYEFTDLEKIWFVVSPQNPLKKRSSLLDDYQRLHLVRLAIEDSKGKFHVSNIEFEMPKPSYTIDTLTYLKEKYQNNEFIIIMGADNLLTLNKWRNRITSYNVCYTKLLR